MEKVKEMLFEYEFWFQNKLGRNSKKIKKKVKVI